MGPPVPEGRRPEHGVRGGARGRASRAAHGRDPDPPARGRPRRRVPERRPRLVRDRCAGDPPVPGHAALVRHRVPRPALRRERVPGPLRRRARERAPPRRRRLPRHRRAPAARGRALGEADAPDRARAAPAALRSRPRRRAQGRDHRRGRGRAVRRLRHLPRERGAPVLGTRARVEAQAAALHAPERLPRQGPRASRRLPRRLLPPRSRGRRRPAVQPPAAVREHRALPAAARTRGPRAGRCGR